MRLAAILAAAALTAACGEAEIADVAVTAPGSTMGAAGPYETGTATAVACSQYGALDRDNDQLIEDAEYNQFGDGVFADWDLNDDNLLAREEFERCWNAGGWTATPTAYDANALWTSWEDNNDGFLDENEFFGEDEFAEWDADDTAALEAGEWG